jgi:hypothetical protein
MTLKEFTKQAVSVPWLSSMIRNGLKARGLRWERTGRPADMVMHTAKQVGLGSSFNKRFYKRIEKLPKNRQNVEENLLGNAVSKTEFGRRTSNQVATNFANELKRMLAKHFGHSKGSK